MQTTEKYMFNVLRVLIYVWFVDVVGSLAQSV